MSGGGRGPGDQPESSGAALRACEDLVKALTQELDETNQGLIALYAELERVRGSESQLAAIVTSSADAMLSIDPDRTIVTWNAGSEHLLGYAPADAIGQPLYRLIFSEDAGAHGRRTLEEAALTESAFEAGFRRIAAGEQAAGFDAWMRRKDGSPMEASVTLSAMLDPTGAAVGWSVILHDLTTRRRIEAELAASRAAEEVLADRERIGQELHAHVIQRLFAAALDAQAAAALVDRPEIAERIQAQVTRIDEAIAELRSTIFRSAPPTSAGPTLPERITGVAAAAAQDLGYEPELRLDIDRDLPPHVVEEAVTVAREALAGAPRRPGGSPIAIAIRFEEDLVLRIGDGDEVLLEWRAPLRR